MIYYFFLSVNEKTPRDYLFWGEGVKNYPCACQLANTGLAPEGVEGSAAMAASSDYGRTFN
jgi:hypothetical protein